MSGPPAAPPTPLTQLLALYEQAEAKAAALAEQAVGSNVFAELLATTATNVMALAGVANSVVDRGVRLTRFAARADVTGLARQLARTEDKLERLLQEVQEISGRLAVPDFPPDHTSDDPSDDARAARPARAARAAAPRNGATVRTSR
ncbi:hypothetical protein [Kineosporia sp. R_H_3]|uniref:hypothetical protein n=1 Tax=Kineosporia sp. R_H_3 TaxID=1961848 RepID=UPI000B4C14D6|nr:hypothetical protein [Kineosporia sp. R_H_3]